MFKTILIAIDGSEIASKALQIGLELAKAHEARVLIMTATASVDIPTGSSFGTIDAASIIERLDETYARQAGEMLAEAQQKAKAQGIEAQVLHLPHRQAADAIVETAEEKGMDLIVMGSHGRRGLRRLLLGSQAGEVLARAQVPVMIVK